MAIHTADAIILRRTLYRETSVIVSCLTDRFGKIKGLVKGLRMHPNRHRSAMEPLTVNRLVFYDTQHSQLHLISQCELMGPLMGIQQDLGRARCGAFCAELADAVVPLDDPQPAVYHLLHDTLERLAISAADPAALRVHFTLRLLRLAGFQPRLDECAGCNEPVEAEGYWSPRQGGLLCRRCLAEDPKAAPVSAEVLQALVASAGSDHPDGVPGAWLPALSRYLNDFLHWRLDHPLKTLNAV
jgi:DNA repair protein RecO (recombination protein O)